MANDDAVREAAAKLLAANEGAREYGQTQSIAQKMTAKELREALAAAPASPPAEQLDEVRRPWAWAIAYKGEPTAFHRTLADAKQDLAQRDRDYPEVAAQRAIVPLYPLAGKGEENLPTEGKGE